MKPIRTLIVIVGCAALSACAGLGVGMDASSMTAAQLKAVASDKNAGVSCVVLNLPHGRSTVTSVNLDKGVLPDGSVSVDAECKITVTSNGRQKTP